MGFGDLPPIETADSYLDSAFSNARTLARKHTLAEHDKSKLQKERTLGFLKMNAVKDYLIHQFDNIIAKYPNMDNLPEFYVQLLRLTLNFKQLKKSLGSLNWAKDQIRVLNRHMRPKLLGATDVPTAQKAQNMYYGRVSSVLKQIKKELAYLHLARQTMRDYPSVKEDLYTICIAGFPNVGKSTVLSKLTPAKPEISSYAFTTKKLNMGYATKNAIKFQYIDTPGTLNRTERMNFIEKQAYIAMKYVGDVLLYVFDITESCGYTLHEQKKLLTRLKDYDKPIICFLAKTDLLTDAQVEGFQSFFGRKKIPLFTEHEEIEDYALAAYKESQK